MKAELADYLCDPNFTEITTFPSDVDSQQAMKNLDLYIGVISNIILEKEYFKSLGPTITFSEDNLSHITLPYLLTENLGTQTVEEFLTDTWEDVLKENLEEMESILAPVSFMFLYSQLNLTYKRLQSLRSLIEDS